MQPQPAEIVYPFSAGLLAAYVGAILLSIGATAGAALWARRRAGGTWIMFPLGAATFFVFQIVLRIPLVVWLGSLPQFRAAVATGWPWLLYMLGLSFTAGLMEETGRWVALRYCTRPADRTRGNALMLGAGHGGIEALGVAALQLIAATNYVVLFLMPLEGLVPPEQMGAVQDARRQFASLAGWEPLAGGWERVCAVAVHLGLSLVVWRGFRGGGWKWWGAAVTLHTLVNLTTILVLVGASRRFGGAAGILASEACVAAWAVAAVAWIVWTRRYDGPAPAASDGPADAPAPGAAPDDPPPRALDTP